MLRLGGQRFAVKPSGLPQMQALFEELPNFAEVLEHIRRQLALCVDSEDDIELPPILLLGEPGHRQDAFRAARVRIARHRLRFRADEFAHPPAGLLSGASSQWKNAKPGKVFETFLNGEYANPVLVVDESTRRAPTASTIRWARSTNCFETPDRNALHRRVRGDPDRRLGGGLVRHRQRRGAHSRGRCSTA